MPARPDSSKQQCSLLLFAATPTEEKALEEAARSRNLAFEKIKDSRLGEYHWMGAVGNATVIAVRPAREQGQIVMGALGRLGSAAKSIRFREATGAQGIVQLGMAFGIDPQRQKPGDVLASSSLIPYDNRTVRSVPRSWLQRLLRIEPNYIVEYSNAKRQLARASLVELFRREQERGAHSFDIYIGAILSGAARIHSRRFRDELIRSVPAGDGLIVGGEMEGVGLIAASFTADDPIWCVVKGISDFADEDRDTVIEEHRPLACRNAAEFVLSALVNDARG
jgi:adenosylhomocysteine nucleosidase